MNTPMHPATLEEIRARVAEPLPLLGGKHHLDHITASHALDDRAALLAEVDRLRLALAGHLFDGESLNTREAVRTGMIQMGITAYDALRGVQDLVKEVAWHEAHEGCVVDLCTPKGWVDLTGRLNAVLAKADPTPAPSPAPPARRSN